MIFDLNQSSEYTYTTEIFRTVPTHTVLLCTTPGLTSPISKFTFIVIDLSNGKENQYTVTETRTTEMVLAASLVVSQLSQRQANRLTIVHPVTKWCPFVRI